MNLPKKRQLPVQELLKGQYLSITRLHKDLDHLSTVPHRHDHYEVMLVTEGRGRHLINYQPYDIQPAMLYFIQKGQVHLIDHFERDGWLILFGEELYNRFLQIHPRENDYGLLDIYSDHPFLHLDDTLMKIFQLGIEQLQTELSAQKQDLDIMMHYVSLLLLHANRFHARQYPIKSLSLHHRELFHQLKKLIELHFSTQHLAAFYADQLQMDIKKINRVCREATGQTLFELLQQRLVTESKIQLQTSSQSIKEICYQLGFNDPSFFGRFFKKHTGFSPADFRKARMI